jgi:hypothetical protein
MMRRLLLRRALVAAGAFALAAGAAVTAADAHQSPAGCDSNSVDVTPTRDKLMVRNGDVINYKVSIRNLDREGQTACDLSNATVTFTLPAPDGTPTGTKLTLASDTNYPVGTSITFPDLIPWTVNVNPGVTDAVVQAEVNGTLHDAPVDHAAAIRKTLGTTVTQPHTTLTVAATPAGGRAPLPVTYTYTEKNDSSTDVPITGVGITDSNCSPVAYQGGDAGNDGILATNETWTYTCATTLPAAGSITSNVIGKGTSSIDNRPVDDELATTTVLVRSPHALLVKTVTPARGAAPLDATYSYSYINDGTDPIGALALVDDRCAPLVVTGGDLNADSVVQPGEKWDFTCTQRFVRAGTFKNVVTATGIDTVDNQPVPPLKANATVVVTSPRGAAAGAVDELPKTGSGNMDRTLFLALAGLAAGAALSLGSRYLRGT